MDGKLAFTIQRDSTTNPLVRIKIMVSTSKYFAVKPTLCKINQNFLLDFVRFLFTSEPNFPKLYFCYINVILNFNLDNNKLN